MIKPVNEMWETLPKVAKQSSGKARTQPVGIFPSVQPKRPIIDILSDDSDLYVDRLMAQDHESRENVLL